MTDGNFEEFWIGNELKTLLQINLNLTRIDSNGDSHQDHVLSLGVVLPPITVEVKRPDGTAYVLVATGVAFIIVSACVWACIFKASHELIKPLRHLNDRMLEILDEENEGDADIKTEESCLEIKEVNEMFQSLI